MNTVSSCLTKTVTFQPAEDYMKVITKSIKRKYAAKAKYKKSKYSKSIVDCTNCHNRDYCTKTKHSEWTKCICKRAIVFYKGLNDGLFDVPILDENLMFKASQAFWNKYNNVWKANHTDRPRQKFFGIDKGLYIETFLDGFL
jgi:hypothetical protein